MFSIGLFVAIRRIQMLNQSAALAHIEHLKAAADCEDREIMRQRCFDQRGFDSVALRIRRLRFRLRAFAIAGGIYIRSAGQNQSLKTSQ